MDTLERAAKVHNQDYLARLRFGDTWQADLEASKNPQRRIASAAQHTAQKFAPATALKRGIRLLTPAECDAQPGRTYVIKGLLSEGDLCCIFGPPGAGKSINAPHLGYCVAQGRAAFGLRTKQGPVFYVAAEDAHGMRQRVRALKQVNGDAPGFVLVEGVSNLLDPEQLTMLCALVAARRPRMVIVDTIALAFPGIDENGSADMGRVVATGRRLAETGAAVVLIHHDTKSGSGTPRGHSILNGALDVSLHLTRDAGGKIVSGRLVKNRNGTCDLTIAFQIRGERIGVDEDGDTVTAPIAVELSRDAVRAGTAKLHDPAAAALDLLRGLIADGVRLPDGRRAVTEKQWRDECDDALACSKSENAESRAKAFQRSYKELLKHKFVVSGDGYVSLPVAAS